MCVKYGGRKKMLDVRWTRGLKLIRLDAKIKTTRYIGLHLASIQLRSEQFESYKRLTIG